MERTRQKVSDVGAREQVNLYNKYRPKRFDEVVDQTIPVKTLENAICDGSIASAYLLSGLHGSGKTTIGRIFAKALLCTDDDRNEADGCDECSSCELFDRGANPDFIEIDAASNSGVDNIRSLRDSLMLPPMTSARRVVLIDEAHMLTAQACAALLKVLEEPPKSVVFILATTDPYKLKTTIRSRCQWLQLGPISLSGIIGRLELIESDEDIDVAYGVNDAIAKQANGSLRDAITMLDETRTATGRGAEITLDDVYRSIGGVPYDIISELVDGMISNDLGKCLGYTVKTTETSQRIDNGKSTYKTTDYAKPLIIEIMNIMSMSLIVRRCGGDALRGIDSAQSSEQMLADRFAEEIGSEKRTLEAIDAIERQLWKFDVSALQEDHVYNEIIIDVLGKLHDEPYDEKIDSFEQKIMRILKTVAKAENINLDLNNSILDMVSSLAEDRQNETSDPNDNGESESYHKHAQADYDDEDDETMY